MPTAQKHVEASTATKGSHLSIAKQEEVPPRVPTHTSAKFTTPKQLKRPPRKRFKKPGSVSKVDPAKAVTINGTVVYLFEGPILEKYDFLTKANEALTLAVAFLDRKAKQEEVTDTEYFELKNCIDHIKAGYQLEHARIPMNPAAKKKYTHTLAQLELVLEAIY